MTTLHILNKPPHHPRFEGCLKALGSDDMLLLMESAVLAVSVSGLLPTGRVCALKADLEARGLSEATCGGIAIIDYGRMVGLTAESARIIHW
ncbi:MAG: sulfurtransferase complex subunit TusB [Pseudomonadota bacterium]|nr:sulfurtransferase complex subunit TusB [Pseudomonadota bacterium]